MTLAVLDQWRQDINPAAMVTLKYQAQYLIDGVFHHALTRQVGIGIGRTGIKQAQVVIHLGRRADGAARVAVHGLLTDRDDGTQTRNLVHIGALKHPHHVAGIGGKSLEITALPLGKHCVKRQRRLAAATQTGHHREPVVRNLDIDVLEVVHPGTQHLDTLYILPIKLHSYNTLCSLFLNRQPTPCYRP